MLIWKGVLPSFAIASAIFSGAIPNRKKADVHRCKTAIMARQPRNYEGALFAASLICFTIDLRWWP
jgi:hypothetical protein